MKALSEGQQHLEQTGGIHSSARQIQRMVQRVGATAQQWQERPAKPAGSAVPIMYVSADGTGVPMRKEELVGRAGKQPDGGAKTRFTQHKTDENGHPVRDYESTTYVSSFSSIEEFGPCLRQDAIRCGLAVPSQVVLLIDGAEGLANMGRLCFAGATQIVDFYHALEHGGQVLVALLGNKDHPEYRIRLRRWAERLLNDKVEQLIAEMRQECAGGPQAAAVEKELGYFLNNIDRMQYGTFRRKGFFIGSGVIEAGCKTVVGARCKQSGMFWGEPARKMFWPCAAFTAAAGWASSGKSDLIAWPPAMTPSRSQSSRRFLSCAPVGNLSETPHGRQRCWDENGDLISETFWIEGMQGFAKEIL